jgi:hypothetical protein
MRLALCGLALLVEHVAKLGSNYTGDHLVAGLVTLTAAVIVWCLPSEVNEELKAPRIGRRLLCRDGSHIWARMAF